MLARQQLVGKQYAARMQQFQAGLDELNFEASLAQNLSSMVNQQFAANARADAESTNKLNGSIASGIVKGIGGIAGMAFGPSISAFGNSLAGGLSG